MDQIMHDVIVVGAGAAGLFFAGSLVPGRCRVLLIDHSRKLAEKVRISGGGRCNITNLEGAKLDRYHGQEPRFARQALNAFGPEAFLSQFRRDGLSVHEKHRGQLFCDQGSEAVIRWLDGRAQAAGAKRIMATSVHAVQPDFDDGPCFRIDTDAGVLRSRMLVIATGGPSIPAIGASDWGQRFAQSLGLKLVKPRPALVPLNLQTAWMANAALAGVSLRVRVSLPEDRSAPSFDEDLLFTHRGLSGPAILQISSYWAEGQTLELRWAPKALSRGFAEHWVKHKAAQRLSLERMLGGADPELAMPKRFLQQRLGSLGAQLPDLSTTIDQWPDRAIRQLGDLFERDRLQPTGTEGWKKAEVAAGGVDVSELDPRSMQSLKYPGLFFIGEVVDITGWLGGYNFQWAWASAWSAARAISAILEGYLNERG
ncbi:MAG: aminoacetone oxidase family FAD-binding enzyme [Betaproteobacteria bacterium]|jgi:predicted Rossmann fold flavoprotein|nr:aminoacetone oxidase family FAD-binding enzyme [Pseudomonadota bacterium]NBO04707.1 aminoacetone oxidase family FAD-binding enzyme [Betaproteobacteria bacterium]NBO96297.1 aminoacetone oxidase family FAD-binding enzyme [Betaproteobacteria bacterium]NBP39315.1 aminoacetone oxidase family FAD-binding enzyme [Betaproteobacteria bacterium]NBQ78859.1 aminoacetone oxidase family FAD-binding enzyme [Betaproteobacteria bacterium]